MTKTIEDLKKRAQEVAKLDKERTQDAPDLVLGRDTSLRVRGQDYYQSLSEEDRAFLCFSPAMAKLIADQQAKIEELEKQVLEQEAEIKELNDEMCAGLNLPIL